MICYVVYVPVKTAGHTIAYQAAIDGMSTAPGVTWCITITTSGMSMVMSQRITKASYIYMKSMQIS